MAVRVTFHHGRKSVRVTFKRSKRTAAQKRALVARGKKLARKFKLVWIGKKGHKKVFLKVGKRLRKIRQPHR
jgi:hypothetical protein